MGERIPKQYLLLNGKPIIEYALSCLASHPLIKGIVVAIAADDTHWHDLSLGSAKLLNVVPAGKQRCHSVINGLCELERHAHPGDWVLVHDAVRPCLRTADIDKLIKELATHPVGGLLATPACDTMKRANSSNEVIETVDRNGLWHALTPQMFRLSMLKQALLEALEKGVTMTDEASAMEMMGLRPCLVAGSSDNIKITTAQDLVMAELLLRAGK